MKYSRLLKSEDYNPYLLNPITEISVNFRDGKKVNIDTITDKGTILVDYVRSVVQELVSMGLLSNDSYTYEDGRDSEGQLVTVYPDNGEPFNMRFF